jgi:hypothetical protein
MASTTGIELASQSCVLVGVRPGRAGTGDVLALQTIGPSEWPANDTTLAEVLESVRRAQRLPRRAAVVAWGLPDDSMDGASTRAALRFIEAAGFRVESVLTPPQALARLASLRPRQNSADAVAWLALNVHGVAIAIVRSSELLFARTFRWKYNPDLMETKAQLLQRYSLVAHLAPEVRHGIAVVRASHGASVDAVVTCGDLPELRSLTMPLIEELDLEVETLDSAEGLRAARNVKPERLMEAAPAIRLACAAALTSALTTFESQPIGATMRREQPSAMRRATAAVALVAALVWGVYAYSNVFTSSPVRPMPVPLRGGSAQPAQTSVRAEPKVLPPASTTRRGQTPAPQGPVVKDESKPVSTVLSVRNGPEPKQVPAAPPLGARSTPAPSGPPQMVLQRPAGPDQVEPTAIPRAVQAERRSPTVPVTPSSTLRTGPDRQTGAPTDMRSEVFPSAATMTPGTRYVPLKDPLPQVDSILVDQERRLAIIDGMVVGVGDAVGPRRVSQIESDTVDLREPSGLLVRVHVRPKSAR